MNFKRYRISYTYDLTKGALVLLYFPVLTKGMMLEIYLSSNA